MSAKLPIIIDGNLNEISIQPHEESIKSINLRKDVVSKALDSLKAKYKVLPIQRHIRCYPDKIEIENFVRIQLLDIEYMEDGNAYIDIYGNSKKTKFEYAGGGRPPTDLLKICKKVRSSLRKREYELNLSDVLKIFI